MRTEKQNLQAAPVPKTEKQLLQALFREGRRRAKEKGLDFTIRLDDVPGIPSHCPILGIPIVAGSNNLHPGSPSLDRIDSTRGYIPGNVKVISHRANVLKGNMTLAEAENLVKYMKGE
jgi:hypothetical protein